MSAALSIGCQYPELVDHGYVCVSTAEIDGQHRLTVAVQSEDSCVADYKGASLECTVGVDGSSVAIMTIFKDGKDPDSGCLGPLETRCEVDVEPGSYTLEFDDETLTIDVPGGEQACFGYDFDTEG
ncbi:MAG TPA: hypothetical protein VK034_11105 [Enhygromyxa sp.]|nr:hypothetical protein [Enhygromyxa sp.]